jgi:hypothetical protein
MDRDGGATRHEPRSRRKGAVAPAASCCAKPAVAADMRPVAEPVAGPYPVPR